MTAAPVRQPRHLRGVCSNLVYPARSHSPTTRQLARPPRLRWEGMRLPLHLLRLPRRPRSQLLRRPRRERGELWCQRVHLAKAHPPTAAQGLPRRRYLRR